jgi:flavorubredoxin
VTEVFKSKALLVGSPTINRGILSAVAGFMEHIRELKFMGKRAAAFGTYGWSGESVNMIIKGLEGAGFELAENGLKSTWNPDENSLEKSKEFGKEIAIKTKM